MKPNRNTILISVMVVCFALSAYFVYRSFATPTPAGTVGSSALAADGTPAVVPILPLGKSLDLSILKKLNTDYTIFSYPLVTKSDVGLDTTGIMKAPEPAQKNQSSNGAAGQAP